MNSPPTDEMLSVLQHIHTNTWALQSNDARGFAFTLAQAACQGYVTTEVMPGQGTYGTLWKITPKGIHLLRAFGDNVAEHELAAFRAKVPDPAKEAEICPIRCHHPNGDCHGKNCRTFIRCAHL